MNRLRLLVIEDDEVDRMAIRRHLRHAAMDIEEVADGAAGVAVLAEGRHDCALLDLHLPGLGGLEVLERLGPLISGGGAVPIVMLTGQGGQDAAVAAMKRGAADYLAKDGLTSERLATTIGNAAAAANARREAARAQAALAAARRVERGILGAARALLSDQPAANALSAALRAIAEPCAASRAALFLNHTIDGALGAHLAAISGDPLRPESRASAYRAGLQRWANDLANGEHLASAVLALPAEEARWLPGVLAVLVIPLHRAEGWGGFVRIDHSAPERRWFPEEVRLLRMAVDMIGAWLDQRERANALVT